MGPLGQNSTASALQAAVSSVTAVSLALCIQAAAPSRAFGDEEASPAAESATAAQGPAGPESNPGAGAQAGSAAGPQPAGDSASAANGAAGTSGSAEAIAPATSPDALTQNGAEDLEQDAERLAKEEEAAGKRAEADSLYGQISALNAPLRAAREEYDAARERHDEAATLKQEASEQLEAEKAALVGVKVSVSHYLVDLYKQGGAAPYLDVICGARSYREFLTSWYMANEVAQYGHTVLNEKNRVIRDVEAALADYEQQEADAEKDMQAAEAKVNQTILAQLSLAVQAASLRVDAAGLIGDEAALNQAIADLNSANAALDEAIASGIVGDSLLVGNGYFTNPLPSATISSGFGYRAFTNSFHKGLDMAAPSGTPYYAGDSGTVISANNDGDYNGGAGNMVVIDHGNGIVTKYMHSLVVLVRAGDHVERGQNIGLVGSTGHSTGPHLHFQVEINGTAVNPANYI